MSDVKFPDVTVPLTGEDGNAFFIIGRTRTALKRGGATNEEVDAFIEEAQSGDYNNVLQTVQKWVNVT